MDFIMIETKQILVSYLRLHRFTMRSMTVRSLSMDTMVRDTSDTVGVDGWTFEGHQSTMLEFSNRSRLVLSKVNMSFSSYSIRTICYAVHKHTVLP